MLLSVLLFAEVGFLLGSVASTEREAVHRATPIVASVPERRPKGRKKKEVANYHRPGPANTHMQNGEERRAFLQSVSSYDAIPRGSHHGRRQSEEEGSAKNDNDDVVLDMPHAVGASGPRARVEGMSLVGLFFNLLLYPLFFFVPLFTSFYTVAPQQHVLVTFWGSLAKVAKRPGAFKVRGGGFQILAS
jgi:hypothetical protein